MHGYVQKSHRLAKHHLVWLEKHPERDEGWLRARLADGFDIHHLDGNHANNDPGNLVLIDAKDHSHLHYGKLTFTRGLKVNEASLEIGRDSYEAKVPSVSWSAIGARFWPGLHRDFAGPRARYAAQRYADAYELPWPKPGSARKGGAPRFSSRAIK